MHITQPDILKTLQDAQLAHKSGDFMNALEFYEYFFDHALNDDPYALYGVRLSHCLEGWAKLADVFPGANLRLQQKREEVLQSYQESKKTVKFHDYYCISKVQNKQNEALDLFKSEYQKNPKSAEKLTKYVWDDLVEAQDWDLCSALLKQPEQKIDELFAVYDEAQNLKSVEPMFDTNRFDQHLIETLTAGVGDIVQILRFNNRADEISSIERQFNQAVDTRNNASLTKAVHAKASFLFIGH